ncbi:DUF1217 domain-containing protein [Falsiroseomonas ponticola]|uniref:DUF1217 domain-containing protein n=1 Tax=Falsiroseomonas ponticola TaxID=2786951 RepID=UPI00193145C2|nr:DUF1217 domain-containing protein [Roseomonas ponticola]
MLTGAQLSTLFGSDNQTVTLTAPERFTFYKTSLSSAEKETARLRKDPAILRDMARLDRVLARARKPDDLFRDTEAVRVLMQGLGLADNAQNVGMAKRVLMSDLSDKKSLALNLSDKRWKTAAEKLDMFKTGLSTLRLAATRQTILDGLVDYKRLTAIEEKSQAVSDALYLKTMSTTTRTGVYDVLGNKVLRRIASTIAGLPKELALQEVEAQARTLQRGFKVEDLADPAKKEKLIQRYLTIAEDKSSIPAPNFGFTF